MKFLTNTFRKLKPPGNNFIPSATNCALVSYPKSGNTWVRFLIANLLSGGVQVNLHQLEFYVPDIYSTKRSRFWNELDSDIKVFKSHECFKPEYNKVIYLIRDPRDVCVSYFQYLFGKNLPVTDSFVEKFAMGQVDGFGSWGEHVKSWQAISIYKKKLILKYEDMINDVARESVKMIRFLGIELDKNLLNRAITNSSFENLKKIETYKSSIDWRKNHLKDSNAVFFNKGETSIFLNKLSDKNINIIETAFREQMIDMGYELV